MELIFIKVRVCALILIIANIVNETTSRQICMAQVVAAPTGLITFLVYFLTLFLSMLIGLEMPRFIICFFDVVGVLMFATTAFVVFTDDAFSFRTFADPVVLNAFLPLVAFFLMLADLALALTYRREEPDDDDDEDE